MTRPPPRAAAMGVISAPPNAASSSALSRKLRFAANVQVLGASVPRVHDDDGAVAATAGKRRRGSAADKDGDSRSRRRHGSSSSGGGAAGSATAASSGMVFNKGFGQHILKNPLVITAIVEKAAVKPTDVVLEIGPGTGNLTEKLLQTAKKVIAFEIDPRMVAELNKRFQGSPLATRLSIVRGNCLDHTFPYFDKCVANVPYAISSALVFKLLRQPRFACAVLMFQREFALRICAQPGSEAYCRLSVNAQLLARCTHLMKISRNSFNPPPKVESSVIRLDPRHPQPDVDFDEWDGMVRMLFNRKNKKASSLFRTRAAMQELYEKYKSYHAHNSSSNNNKADNKQQQQQQKGAASDDTAAVAVVATFDAFKTLLEGVLADAMFEQRARMLDEEALMRMLGHFTHHGIHFV